MKPQNGHNHEGTSVAVCDRFREGVNRQGLNLTAIAMAKE